MHKGFLSLERSISELFVILKIMIYENQVYRFFKWNRSVYLFL